MAKSQGPVLFRKCPADDYQLTRMSILQDKQELTLTKQQALRPNLHSWSIIGYLMMEESDQGLFFLNPLGA